MRNLSVKRITALVLAGATFVSFAGCTPSKENGNAEDTPVVIDEVIEDEPITEDVAEPVVREKFDITDDAVFNQKVDELYSKIQGACSYRANYGESDLYCVDDRSKVSAFFAMLNIDSISKEQLHYITDYPGGADVAYNVFFLTSEAYAMNNSSNPENYISLTDYYAGTEDNIELLLGFDKLAKNTYESENISEENAEYVALIMDLMAEDIQNNTQNKLALPCIYNMLNCVSGCYELKYGYRNDIFLNGYESLKSKFANFNDSFTSAVDSDINTYLN